MYELLLKWGLDSLPKLVGDRDRSQTAILLEAIKTKNILIQERYKYAWEVYRDVLALTLEIENSLEEYSSNSPSTENTKKTAWKLLGNLKTNFHPTYYRKMKKLRSNFECTNDLMSSYTRWLLEITNFQFFEELCEKQQYYTASSIFRSYRGLWTFYSEMLGSLIRVTSSDLRFWLTDKPYVEKADLIAQEELKLVKEFLLEREVRSLRFHLQIVTEEGLYRFWEKIEK